MSQLLRAYPASDITIKLACYFLDCAENHAQDTMSAQIVQELKNWDSDPYSALLAYSALDEAAYSLLLENGLLNPSNPQVYNHARAALRTYLKVKV